MTTATEILMIESSTCSASTVYTVAECTTITVSSTYTSSCPCASLEKLVNALATATCTVEHFTKAVVKTVMLSSLPSSLPCKNISTLLITALPTPIEDIGYVEAAECAGFCIPHLFAYLHVKSARLSFAVAMAKHHAPVKM